MLHHRPAMLSVPRVLVVEDDESIRGLLLTALRREMLQVDAADDGEEALHLTAIHEYAVIVLDLMMPRVDGFAFLEKFHSHTRNGVPVIFVVTAFDDLVFERIPAHQAHAIIRKPFDALRLANTVRDVATAIQTTKVTPPEVDVTPPMEAIRPLDSIC
jgi:DNA-binding response OmpR family regulator